MWCSYALLPLCKQSLKDHPMALMCCVLRKPLAAAPAALKISESPPASPAAPLQLITQPFQHITVRTEGLRMQSQPFQHITLGTPQLGSPQLQFQTATQPETSDLSSPLLSSSSRLFQASTTPQRNQGNQGANRNSRGTGDKRQKGKGSKEKGKGGDRRGGRVSSKCNPHLSDVNQLRVLGLQIVSSWDFCLERLGTD